MFERIKDFIPAWPLSLLQFACIAVFLAWWLIGAAWLLQRSLRKRAGLRYPALGPCVLALFLSGLGALAVGGLTFMLVRRIGEGPEARAGASMMALAMAPAVLLAVPMAFLVLYAVFQLPWRLLLRVTWPAMTSVAAAAAVTGVPAFWLGWSLHVDVGKAQVSVSNLTKIDDQVREHERIFDSQVPAGLMALTEERQFKGKTIGALLTKGALQCPFLPGVPVGYFYHPAPSVERTRRDCQELRACEWTHPQSAKYRAMLFANGDARFNPDEDFQGVLRLPVNAEFAREFRARDANRE